MNSIEFKKVLNAFGIKDVAGNTTIVDGKNKNYYSWKGVDIVFGGTYYAVVMGCVPYEVARIMSKRYPDYREDVRIHGCYGYGKVKDKKFYPTDDMGNAYIESYHIDSVEGLVYLLSEIKYFYEVRTYTEESRKALFREQHDILASIYQELIKEGNPTYTTEEWMKNHNIPINEEYDEIRELVKQFDEMVNPFINPEVEVKDPSEFVDKLNMEMYYGEDNLLSMTIRAKEAESHCNRELAAQDGKEFLQYDFYYDIEPDYIMNVNHTITDGYDEIRLYGFHEKGLGDDKIDLRFDMNKGVAYTLCNKNHHHITDEEREIFKRELEKAIKIGKKQIVNRMTKKSNNLVKRLK